MQTDRNRYKYVVRREKNRRENPDLVCRLQSLLVDSQAHEALDPMLPWRPLALRDCEGYRIQ